MPRRSQHSGQYMIDRARTLFEASVKAGNPDYGLVALAVGAAPIAPPRWAIEACIALKEEQERRSPALAHGGEVDRVLDELVRFYDREQQQRDAESKPHLGKPTSLRAALLKAYSSLGEQRDGSANDDWLRTARRAWEKEQVEDRRQSYLRLDGFHITGRIERVLMAVQGAEFGYPGDPIKAAWLLKNGSELE